MGNWTEEQAKKIKEDIERLSPELQKTTWDALQDGADLIYDGDEIVGVVWEPEKVTV